MSIKFIENGHKYINDENNHEYISATKFLHLFEPEFDADKISGFVAKKRGITKEEVLKEWNEINKKSTTYGTKIHELMENYIKFNKIDNEYQQLYESYNKIISELSHDINEIHSEKILWNDTYEIAGTSDLIIDYNNDEFSVGDFKTNKKFLYYSQYNNNMLEPVKHLSSCQHNLYALQLSLYAYFYSLLSGKKLRHIFLLYTNDITKGWEYIPCNYMHYEIIFMLKYYKSFIKSI